MTSAASRRRLGWQVVGNRHIGVALGDSAASRRIRSRIARYFVQHYLTAWETGKAMVICIDKVTCVRMYELIVKYWDQGIKDLEATVSHPVAGHV